jgi:D-alanyl-D-alanine dipeptidase
MKVKNTIITKDNHEPLVDIRKYLPKVKIALDKRRLKIETTAFVRLSVAKKLREAQKLLPPGMNIVIRDSWRPAFVQAQIYFEFIRSFQKKYPRLSHAQIVKEVEKYVAPWKGSGVSGHMTGGAVDLRLIDRHGRLIPLRSKKLNYAENSSPLSEKLPAYLKRNREILRHVLSGAGLANCPNEFWHWAFGDYYWAKWTGSRAAIYGPVADRHNLYGQQSCPCSSGKKFAKCHGKNV